MDSEINLKLIAHHKFKVNTNIKSIMLGIHSEITSIGQNAMNQYSGNI